MGSDTNANYFLGDILLSIPKAFGIRVVKSYVFLV